MTTTPLNRFGCAALLLGMIGAAAPGEAMAQTPSILSLPPAQGYAGSEAWLITTSQGGARTIIGTSSNPGPVNPQLTRWTADPAPGTGTSSGQLMEIPSGLHRPWTVGISADGQRVVGSVRSVQTTREVPALWTGSSFLQLPLPAGTPGDTGRAAGISADGSVVVGVGWTTGIRWQNGVIVDTAPGFHSGPLTPDGLMTIGYRVENNQPHLASWTGAGVQNLAPFPSGVPSGAPYAITPTGDAAVGYAWSAPGPRSWIYRGSTIMDLGLPAGADSLQAFGIRGDGDLVVGTAYEGTTLITPSAVVWMPQVGWTEFEPWLAGQGVSFPGWNFDLLTSVSSDGLVFTGYGRDPAGLARGFVVTIPSPGAGAFILLALGVSTWRRLR